MATVYNCAELALDNEYPLDGYYKIVSLYDQENPLDNIPEGCTLVAWADFTFPVEIKNYNILDEENTQAVVNSSNIPLYMIGLFSEN
jgi:hypothetical protein